MKPQANLNSKIGMNTEICRGGVRTEEGEIGRAINLGSLYDPRNRFYGLGDVQIPQIERYPLHEFFLTQKKLGINSVYRVYFKNLRFCKIISISSHGVAPCAPKGVSLNIQNRISKKEESKPLCVRIASHNSQKSLDFREVFNLLELKTEQIATKKLQDLEFFEEKTFKKIIGKDRELKKLGIRKSQKLSNIVPTFDFFRTKSVQKNVVKNKLGIRNRLKSFQKIATFDFFRTKSVQKNVVKNKLGIRKSQKSFQKLDRKNSGREFFRTKSHEEILQK
jgi:hypothetical protein